MLKALNKVYSISIIIIFGKTFKKNNMKIELIQIPKYSSDNFMLIYSAVNPNARNIYHSDGTPARVTNCNNEQLKEIHKLMTDARKHRKGKLAPTIHNDEQHN